MTKDVFTDVMSGYSSMRVLFIINQLGGGGAERVLTLIANHLSKDNDIHILSFSPGISKYPIDQKISVDEITLNKKTALNVAIAIRKNIRKKHPDVFVSFEYHMNMKALLGTIGMFGVKKIVSERNDPARKGGKPGQKQIRELLYRFADILVCQTPDAKSFFSKSIQNKTVIIPNPISDDLPVPWKGDREKVIVDFCRFEKQKNLPLLIDAFYIFNKKHPDYELHIYGDGSEKNIIAQYVNDKKLCGSVKILPPESNIHSIILKAGMFVSSSDYEGISNSMLEALALGIPTICTDCPCGGARMFIKNGENGLLARVGDADDIAKKMELIAENEDFAKKMANNGLKIREKISSDKIVNKWIEVLN